MPTFLFPVLQSFLSFLHCALSSNHYQAPNCQPACFQWLPKSFGAIDLWIAAAIVEIGCTGYNSLEESTWCNYRCICSPSSRGFIEPRLQCNPLVDIHYLSDLFPGLGLMIQLLGGWVFCPAHQAVFNCVVWYFVPLTIAIFCIIIFCIVAYHNILHRWPSQYFVSQYFVSLTIAIFCIMILCIGDQRVQNDHRWCLAIVLVVTTWYSAPWFSISSQLSCWWDEMLGYEHIYNILNCVECEHIFNIVMLWTYLLHSKLRWMPSEKLYANHSYVQF